MVDYSVHSQLNVTITMLGCVFIFSALVVFCQPMKGDVWPKPQSEERGEVVHLVKNNTLEFKVTKHSCKILTTAIERAKKTVHKLSNIAKRNYNQLVGGQIPTSLDTVHTVNVELTKPCDTYPWLGMDESYNLTVSETVSVTGQSIWGVLHGLESFLHLLYQSDDYKDLLIEETKIHDWPRHPHRGLLLDTSRHYLRVNKILTMLDAMAMNKLNVFHWHIVDDHSFPYQSEKIPELSGKGAYHRSMVYTKKDIKKIVEYARNRGIRVIPEMDVPGHTRSWGQAYPHLLTPCDTCNRNMPCGTLDPTNQQTYKLLDQLLEEVREWFPDKYLHLGGDEVDYECWRSNPKIVSYMKQHKIRRVTELHNLFMERVKSLVWDRRIIVWEEVFEEGLILSKDTVVQIWWEKASGQESLMNRVLRAGQKALFSSSWYVSDVHSAGDWERFYVDPRRNISNKTLVHDMIGGEACLWGEYVDNTNVIQRVWPRACGIAERLWSEAERDSGKGYEDTESMEDVRRRIEEQACRMLRRGVQAPPPNGPGFCVV